MTLKEFAEKIGYSEATLKTSFNRTKQRLEKIGIIISKDENGYYILEGEENIPWIHFHGKDLRNQKFGKLTVLELSDKKGINNSSIWKCQCDCGKITYVTTNCLTSGGTQSCGCGSSKNEIGNTYGKLTVIDYADRPEDMKNPGAYWLCQCECGNIVIKNGRLLRSGTVQSCGCLCSKGEEKIKDILTKNSINFISQYNFNDCIFPNTNKLAKFDFYIPDKNYLIEYDGEQHFRIAFRSRGDTDLFEKIQFRDEFKNQYCKNHNIPLIRIPYTKYETLSLEDLLLETSQYIYRKE